MNRVFALIMYLLPAWALAAGEAVTDAGDMGVDEPGELPYELVIGSGCPYSYEQMSDVVEHAFRRKRVNPLWETGTQIAANDLYLAISVQCVVVNERSNSYATSVRFARYDEGGVTHQAEYGVEGYGSDRFFMRRLGESVTAALQVFVAANRGQG